MTITLDIKPEVQAELARQAAAQGRAIEAIAVALLKEGVQFQAEAPSKTGAKDLVELFEPVRGLLTDEEIDVVFSRNPSMRPPRRPLMSGFLLDTNIASETLRLS